MPEAVAPPPEAHRNQNGSQSQHLPNLNSDVERQQVWQQTIWRDIVVENFGGQTKAVAKAEYQSGGFGVGLKAQPALKRSHVVERLVDHRQTYDGVDDVTVDADVEIDPQQHGCGMAKRKQADVNGDVLQLVQKEDHAKQEQDVIISRHHVFCPQIDEGDDVDAGDFLDVALVAFGNSMGKCCTGHEEQGQCGNQVGEAGSQSYIAVRQLALRKRLVHDNLELVDFRIARVGRDQTYGAAFGGRSMPKAVSGFTSSATLAWGLSGPIRISAKTEWDMNTI